MFATEFTRAGFPAPVLLGVEDVSVERIQLIKGHYRFPLVVPVSQSFVIRRRAVKQGKEVTVAGQFLRSGKNLPLAGIKHPDQFRCGGQGADYYFILNPVSFVDNLNNKGFAASVHRVDKEVALARIVRDVAEGVVQVVAVTEGANGFKFQNAVIYKGFCVPGYQEIIGPAAKIKRLVSYRVEDFYPQGHSLVVVDGYFDGPAIADTPVRLKGLAAVAGHQGCYFQQAGVVVYFHIALLPKFVDIADDGAVFHVD
ncbi:MAG: hypothetical protein BWY80_00592 [Firmicutes bacterium ADurb.Bin456]|nr:MAG: hypothetical protein BWY80_00592 [Firmicutes bacterium ADurb.Bin456]